jgi:hypothetical protein
MELINSIFHIFYGFRGGKLSAFGNNVYLDCGKPVVSIKRKLTVQQNR